MIGSPLVVAPTHPTIAVPDRDTVDMGTKGSNNEPQNTNERTQMRSHAKARPRHRIQRRHRL